MDPKDNTGQFDPSANQQRIPSRTLYVRVLDIVQDAKRAFVTHNFGRQPKHIYLPEPLFDLVEDACFAQMHGLIAEELLRDADLVTLHDMEVHTIVGFDIIVTEESL